MDWVSLLSRTTVLIVVGEISDLMKLSSNSALYGDIIDSQYSSVFSTSSGNRHESGSEDDGDT